MAVLTTTTTSDHSDIIKPEVKAKKVQVLSDFENSDRHAARAEYIFRIPVLSTFFEGLLIDKRDVPMVRLQLNILAYIIPGIAFVFYIHTMANPPPLWVRNLCGIGYVVGNTLLFLERFILMMHYSSHRPIFSRRYDFLNTYVLWILAPLYGIPAGVYKYHHVVMHHVENNHEWDISSTEEYHRDSLSGFLVYYLRFSLAIFVEMPYYLYKANRLRQCRSCVAGCIFSGSTIFLLAHFVCFWATFWVLIVPFFVVFLAMSFGNWSQHMFVDPTRPESNYALTYNCIDSFVNQRTFNDGYHVIHHYNGRMHWSELPEHFHSPEALKRHHDEGAITFRNIHFFDVGLLVMTGQLEKLAERHYVHLGTKETAPTVDEVVAKMRSWLVKMPAVPHTGVPGAVQKKAI
jgi:fatty acid desaturase